MGQALASPGIGGGIRLNRRAIPNVMVRGHDGRERRFYQDLVQGRTLVVAFTSIAHDALSGSTRKLSEVRSLLGGTGAQDTLFLSITVDPERDDEPSLARHAGRAGAGAACSAGGGEWLFLTAAPEDVEALRAAFYVHRTLAPVWRGPKLLARAELLRLPPKRAVLDCSMGLLRYGNEALDIWGGAPLRASARDIAARLAWVRGAPSGRRPARRAAARCPPDPIAGGTSHGMVDMDEALRSGVARRFDLPDRRRGLRAVHDARPAGLPGAGQALRLRGAGAGRAGGGEGVRDLPLRAARPDRARRGHPVRRRHAAGACRHPDAGGALSMAVGPADRKEEADPNGGEPIVTVTPAAHRMMIQFNFEPSPRLRFYQFDPLHHDAAIFSMH